MMLGYVPSDEQPVGADRVAGLPMRRAAVAGRTMRRNDVGAATDATAQQPREQVFRAAAGTRPEEIGALAESALRPLPCVDVDDRELRPLVHDPLLRRILDASTLR